MSAVFTGLRTRDYAASAGTEVDSEAKGKTMTTSDNGKTPEPGTPQRQAEEYLVIADCLQVLAERLGTLAKKTGLPVYPTNLTLTAGYCRRAAADLKRAT